MVPAAAISAFLGKTGGRLADAKGNVFLYSAASLLLITGFALLSSFAGLSPVWAAVFLILGNVGQMFMGISLNLTISRTLLKEQTGVGMGLLSLSGFLSGAVSTGIYGKVVDLGADIRLNPLSAFSDSIVYGNIYLVLAVLHVGLLILYHYAFGKTARRAKSAERSKEAV
jgi:DHA2 family metal-tetracycline-proton antiporter-like MFS transporter